MFAAQPLYFPAHRLTDWRLEQILNSKVLAGWPILPTYYIFPFEWPNRDAADRDAAQKVCVVLFRFPAKKFPTYYIFPFERSNRDAAGRDAAQKVCVVLFRFPEISNSNKSWKIPARIMKRKKVIGIKVIIAMGWCIKKVCVVIFGFPEISSSNKN